MLHEKINFKNLSFDELIRLIQACQKELESRGSVTQCYNVEADLSKVVYITGYLKKLKQVGVMADEKHRRKNKTTRC